MLRKGSASRRVWASPPVPTERYELRPCLCVFVARFDRRIFLLFVKNGFVVGVRCQGNSEPRLAGPSLHNTQCSSPTLYTHTVYIELHGRRQAGSNNGVQSSSYRIHLGNQQLEHVLEDHIPGLDLAVYLASTLPARFTLQN